MFTLQTRKVYAAFIQLIANTQYQQSLRAGIGPACCRSNSVRGRAFAFLFAFIYMRFTNEAYQLFSFLTGIFYHSTNYFALHFKIN